MDDEIAARYGTIVQELKGRNSLSRRSAIFFVMFYLYRRLLLAAAIVIFYKNNIAQVLLTFALNTLYLGTILQFRPYKDPFTQRLIVLNEIAILLTIYFLMYFLYLSEVQGEAREILGVALVGFTVLNFAINMIPIIYAISDLVHSWIIYCKRKYGCGKQYSSPYEEFCNMLEKKSKLRVIDMDEDGNCLFRAIARQLYGDSKYHRIVRIKCMDYINLKAEVFKEKIDKG